jgi:hypothetical protein
MEDEMHRAAASMIALGVWLGLVSGALAQATRWQTAPGGDASGDYVSVQLTRHEGHLGGDRSVERITAPGGYTTGSSATVLLSGAEPEEERSLRVHLPYGTALDLAVGDAVHVEARASRVGLGSRHEVLLTRGEDIVLLTTGRASAGGVRLSRGAELPREGSARRFGVRATIAGQTLALVPGELGFLSSSSALVSGSEQIYEGTRPPDAFDQRTFTFVRIRLDAPTSS